MNSLRQPKKEEEIRADDIRAMVISIIKNNVTTGLGLSEKQTLNGKIISLAQQPSRESRPVTNVYPRAFDIKSISSGIITLTRCHFQIQSQYLTLATEPTVTIANGVVCVVYNTSTGVITAAMNYVWTPATPELLPLALYDITASSDGQTCTVTCDRRGSVILFHE